MFNIKCIVLIGLIILSGFSQAAPFIGLHYGRATQSIENVGYFASTTMIQEQSHDTHRLDLFTGYQFSPYIGLELTFNINKGKLDPFEGVRLFRFSSITLAPSLTWPINRWFSISSQLGPSYMAYFESRTVPRTDSTPFDDTEVWRGRGYRGAVSLRWHMSENTLLSLSYDRLKGDVRNKGFKDVNLEQTGTMLGIQWQW